ncbi:MAG: 2Fe-2S iron-sulfur cluster-binding protein [archaeon]
MPRKRDNTKTKKNNTRSRAPASRVPASRTPRRKTLVSKKKTVIVTKTTRVKKSRPVKETARIEVPSRVEWVIRVQRYHPGMDHKPTLLNYRLPPAEGESILDLLLRIKHTQDGSLTFRGSCGYGGCGTCGMTVNGKKVLGCVTQTRDVLDAHHTIEIAPLHDNIIKDLVVNETPFFDELRRVKPWMVPRKHDEKRHHKMGKNDVDALEKTPLCVLCGICNANTKSAEQGELGPAALVKAFRYIHDSRDGDAQRLDSLSAALPVSYSLPDANACPRNIEPGKRILTLQKEWVEKKNTPPRKRGRA